MTRSRSITRSLVVTVLLLELLSAVCLIGAITIHERRLQWNSFDATLLGNAQSLMAAVQESAVQSGDESDDVMLDTRGMRLGHGAIFRVQEEHGRILGELGQVPALSDTAFDDTAFQSAVIDGRHMRFVTLHGTRVIDPGMPGGGVRHQITVIYGMPTGRIWHEVVEAVRFVSIATLLLLGVTATVMVWMLRRKLSPIYELATEAGRISSNDWRFAAPESARETRELEPLVSALEAAMMRLERSFHQQRRFTSDAAHELKTDLAIVKSSLQLLSMRPRTAQEYERGLAQSLDDFTRLETTVQKMLTLSRLEQEPVRGDADARASCSLRAALEDAADQSGAFAEVRSVRLDVRGDGDAVVPVDRHDALLLCSNILSNAIGHSPAGATVRAVIEREGASVRLTVRDHGDGVANEDLPYLFEPFYRGDPSRSRKSGGTGLGLAICRAICQRAGGSIEIANHTESGALVTVVLPATALVTHTASSASLNA